MKLLNLNLEILSSVYLPREDSFLLIKALEVKPKQKVLEIGTGSGIIAIHCAKAGADVTAVDINPKAVECARLNAEQNNVKINILQSDLFSNVKARFDVIIFNPPYLPSDKSDEYYDVAWSGGKSGVEITNEFLALAKKHLNLKGEIYFVASSLADLKKIKLPYKISLKKKIGNEEIFVLKI